jgi:hypothetical protein
LWSPAAALPLLSQDADALSDNDDDRSVSSSNQDGMGGAGGSLLGSTQPEVILSFRPVDREIHPVNSNNNNHHHNRQVRRPPYSL